MGNENEVMRTRRGGPRWIDEGVTEMGREGEIKKGDEIAGAALRIRKK